MRENSAETSRQLHGRSTATGYNGLERWVETIITLSLQFHATSPFDCSSLKLLPTLVKKLKSISTSFRCALRDYGDPESTRLLKAISVGLRFRSLVLDEQSPFRPEKLGHPIVTAPDLKAKVSEMLGQMDLILREANEADLSDPAFLILIWGKGQEKKVQDMIDVWEATRVRLYAAGDDVLMAVEDVSFRQKKEKFVEALQFFCGDIEMMNREYTSRVLTLLRNYVEQKISLLHDGQSAPVPGSIETSPALSGSPAIR